MAIWTRYVWLGIVFLSSAIGAGEISLIGEWQFTQSSFPLPNTCRASVFKFATDGNFLGTDGSFEETKRYTTRYYKNGFLVEFQYVSNNGQKNCQGLPANYVKSNTIETLYIELLSNDKMKVYFGPEETPGFIVFERKNRN